MKASDAQREAGERFLSMHAGDDVLLLPNAWDQASAALIAHAGFPAIATTSAGYAVVCGLPDGERLNREQNIAFAGSIAAHAAVPVTADLEAGYGEAPDAVAATVRQAIAAGLAGCNIEDVVPGSGKLVDFDLAVARIRAGCDAAARAGAPFVLNARTDPYLVGFGDAQANFTEAVRRANAFLEVGAPCVYVPGVRDADTLGRLVKAIHGPLNAHVIAGHQGLNLDEYRRLGVRRLSLGGSLAMATLTYVRDTLVKVSQGDFAYAGTSMSNRELNALMSAWAAGGNRRGST